MKCRRIAFLSFILAVAGAIFAVAGAVVADAQTGNVQPPRAQAQETQIDFGGSVYEAFMSSSTGHGVTQTPKNSMGGLFELHYLKSRYLGLGGSLSFNSVKETFASTPNSTCGNACPTTTVTGKAIVFDFDWIPSVKIGRLRPFGIAGLGLSVIPGNLSTYTVNTVMRPTYVFGGGVDYSLTSRLGVRGEYRYNLYKAPNLSTVFQATGAYTGTSEPMGGVFYVF
jgi:opacity protein-like surface antigen